MKNIIKVFVLGFCVIWIIGCVTTAGFSFLNEGTSAPQPTNPNDIRIYVGTDIGKEYVKLGGVSASIPNELDGKKYSERLKKEASKIGADAIVNFRQVGNMASGIAVKFK
jgi:hypothetical protein